MSKYDGVGEELITVTPLGLEPWAFPTYSEDDVVAVFDLDFIVYSSACMTDDVTIEVTKGGKKKFFKSKSEFNEMLKHHNDKSDATKQLQKSDFIIREIVKPQPVSHALRSVKARVEGIMSTLGANKAEFYVGGKDNFRDKIPLPIPYKGNRKEVRRPTHLKACKDYSIEILGAKSVYGREADDVVTQRSIQIRKQGARAVLVGEDKDAYGTYNIFTFNPKKDFEPFFIGDDPKEWSMGFLGEVTKDCSGKVIKYKGYGLRWKVWQIATGDDTDGYHFLDIAKINLAESLGITLNQASRKVMLDKVGLCDAINSVSTEGELWGVLVEHAKKYYGGGLVTYKTHTGEVMQLDHIGILNLYYHCVHMRLAIADDNTIYTVLRKHGLYDSEFDSEVEICYAIN